jgi:hypothetical protein
MSWVGRDDLHLLCAHRALSWPAIEWLNRRGLLHGTPFPTHYRGVDVAPVGGAELDVREAHNGSPGQVSDEEGHPRRTQGQAQLAGDGLDGVDRRCRLSSGQHAT